MTNEEAFLLDRVTWIADSMPEEIGLSERYKIASTILQSRVLERIEDKLQLIAELLDKD